MSIKTKKILLYTGAAIGWLGLILVVATLIFSFLLYKQVIVIADPQTGTPVYQPIPKALDVNTLYADINAERVKVGLGALAISSVLEQSACLKADDMIARDYWSHNAPDGTQPWDFFNRVGYYYSRAGENLAYKQVSEAGTVENWMNSPKHKDNILGNYTQMGLCSRLAPLYQGSANQTVIINHFATPR